MKLLLIFTMIILAYSSINAQITGTYSIRKLNSNISGDIFFFKNGHYLLDLQESLSDDVIEGMIFSDGSFSQKNNEITLTDKVHGYKIVLLKNNNELQVINGFNWLMKKSFVFFNKSVYNEEKHIPKINVSSFIRKRYEYKKSHKTGIPLYPGIYDDIRSRTSLNIQSNNQYSMMYKSIILSQGSWRRNGNELVLLDSALKQPFYVLIGNNVLISCLLPGDYVGISLYKIYKNKIPDSPIVPYGK